MKNYLRTTIVVFLVLALLIEVIPVSARAIKTSVTGTFITLGEPGEDPKTREWVGGRFGWLVYQCRNDYQQYEFQTSDDRLNGVSDGLIDCFFHWNPDGSLDYAHLWGKFTIYSQYDFTVPAWECTTNGTLNSQWVNIMDCVCQGVGVNNGLAAKFTLTYPDPNWNYAVEGYILEPSGD